MSCQVSANTLSIRATTPIMLLPSPLTAVNGNKHRSLQVILDILRQRRELIGAIDVVDEGALPAV